MTGLFGDLDVASAESNPFDIPDGTYGFFVKEVGDVKPTKSGDKQGMLITLSCLDPEHEGKTLTLWQQVPTETSSPDGKKAAGWLKLLLEHLGVPEDRMNTVGKDDLVDRKITVTVTHNDQGYAQAGRHAEYVSGTSAPAASGGTNPFGD